MHLFIYFYINQYIIFLIISLSFKYKKLAVLVQIIHQNYVKMNKYSSHFAAHALIKSLHWVTL